MTVVGGGGGGDALVCFLSLFCVFLLFFFGSPTSAGPLSPKKRRRGVLLSPSVCGFFVSSWLRSPCLPIIFTRTHAEMPSSLVSLRRAAGHAGRLLVSRRSLPLYPRTPINLPVRLFSGYIFRVVVFARPLSPLEHFIATPLL